jgi:hypothetical protein
LRHKFYTLLDGYVATDEECEALLIPAEDTGKVPVPPHERKARHSGKHNMAKGALRPEDAAVSLFLAQMVRADLIFRPGKETTGPDREERAGRTREDRGKRGMKATTLCTVTEEVSDVLSWDVIMRARHMHMIQGVRAIPFRCIREDGQPSVRCIMMMPFVPVRFGSEDERDALSRPERSERCGGTRSMCESHDDNEHDAMHLRVELRTRLATKYAMNGECVLTPFCDGVRCAAGRLMPFRCAFLFWLWLVWLGRKYYERVHRAGRQPGTLLGLGHRVGR